LQDNRARALLALDKVVEACDVWRELLVSSDVEDAKLAANEMLRSCRRDEDSRRRVEPELRFLEEARSRAETQEPEAVIDHLAQGLLLYPDSSAIEQALSKFLRQLRQKQDPDWSSLNAWMQHQELGVELFEHVLQVLEAQLPASPS